MSRLADTLRRYLPALLTALSVAAILPVLLIGIYNHPCAADDFQNARWSDYLAFQRTAYLHWSGRYFNNLAAALCPLHWHSFGAYRAAVMAMMAAFCLAFALLVVRGLRVFAKLPLRVAVAIGAMAAALLLNNFPSLAEGFFWYTGAVTYVLPATAALCLFCLLIGLEGKAEAGWGILALAALLAAAAIGGNESLLLLCCAVVACGYIYYRKQGLPVLRRFYARLLLVCALCAAVAILAPGNFARQAVMQRNVWMVPPTWLYHSLRSFLDWLADPFLLLYSSLVLLLLWPLPLRLPPVPLWVLFGLPLALILLLGLPAHYALGTVPPPRVMNIVYTFFLLAWTPFLMALAGRLRLLAAALAERGWSFVPQLALIALLIALMSSVTFPALRRANLFVVAKAYARRMPQAYDAELRARYARILAAPGDTVGVAPVRLQAGNVLYTGDVIAAKNARTDAHYGAYFGKEVVFIDSAAGAAH